MRITKLVTFLRILAAGALSLGSTVAVAQAVGDLQSIPSLDVARYLGRWYEVAKFPNPFQKQCVSDTTADYSVASDGSIRVDNQCRLQNGETDQAAGVARQVGGPSSAKLQVRFAPPWLSFVPFVWGDYWIIDLDDRYDLAAVSEPRRKYLWILSRSPMPDESRYSALLRRLQAMGFDIGKLQETAQGK